MKLISHAVFAISLVIEKQYYLAHAQHSQHVSESEEDFDESRSNEHDTVNSALLKRMLNHTFVALIDILFTDGSKRTCTGTIIHDNVVITAAHCFAKSHNKYIQPELTASFVVIGSKKMFESGYEQYLPIERVINHPMFRGWTADVALVYTFAGMMSDKPGTVMSLAGEKMSTPNHSNVTVLSWGHCKENGFKEDRGWKKRSRFQLKHSKTTVAPISSTEEELNPKPKKSKNSKIQLRYQIKQKPYSSMEKTKNTKVSKKQRHKINSNKIVSVTKGTNRAIASSEDETDEHGRNMDDEAMSYELPRTIPKNFYDSFFKNWRRSMGPENNKLTVGTFGFIDVQTCKEMVRKAMPEKYEIKNTNEYVCYSSDEHYVTDEDAGAPAVRHGHLVAVTLGGVECDDEHIAIGIKISCFCSWISDNLPNGGSHLKCCDRCCDEEKPSKPHEDAKEKSFTSRGRKKKIKF